MKVNVTKPASRHVSIISKYLKAANPAAQVRFSASIRAAVARLAKFPMSGPVQDPSGVRMLVVPPYSYLMFYIIDDARGELDVLAIQHPAQDRPYSFD